VVTHQARKRARDFNSWVQKSDKTGRGCKRGGEVKRANWLAVRGQNSGKGPTHPRYPEPCRTTKKTLTGGGSSKN